MAGRRRAPVPAPLGLRGEMRRHRRRRRALSPPGRRSVAPVPPPRHDVARPPLRRRRLRAVPGGSTPPGQLRSLPGGVLLLGGSPQEDPTLCNPRSPVARRGTPDGTAVRRVGVPRPPAGQRPDPQPAGPARAGPPRAPLRHQLSGPGAGSHLSRQHAPLRRPVAGVQRGLGARTRRDGDRSHGQPRPRPLRPLHRRPGPARLWRRRDRAEARCMGPAPLRPVRPP